MEKSFYKDFELIFSYTRHQAIADGILIDVTPMAIEMGIAYPVAVTCAVWDSCIMASEELQQYGQTEEGRLWDVLWMFRNKAKGCDSSVLFFEVLFLMEKESQNIITLKAVCGPGDNAEAVITIMMLNED